MGADADGGRVGGSEHRVTAWGEVRIRDLVVGAHIETTGPACPLIRVVASVQQVGSGLIIVATDGWATFFAAKDLDCMVWASLPGDG